MRGFTAGQTLTMSNASGIMPGGTESFTIEMWAMNPSENTGEHRSTSIILHSGSQRTLFSLWDDRMWFNTEVRPDVPSGYLIYTADSTGVPADNNWRHFAFVRDFPNWYMFRDGVRYSSYQPPGSIGFATQSIFGATSATIYIGHPNEFMSISTWGSSSHRGFYIDDIRITRGVALYTGANLS